MLKKSSCYLQWFTYYGLTMVIKFCSRSELLYTKQRVVYQRFAYQQFEQFNKVQYVLESLRPFSCRKGKYKAEHSCNPISYFKLYDEFEHFRQIKGETIQGYYVRFTKLINDMRNIKMTMPRMQLNSKKVVVKMSEDTMQIIKEDSNFREQCKRKWCSWECRSTECQRPKSDFNIQTTYKDKMQLMQAPGEWDCQYRMQEQSSCFLQENSYQRLMTRWMIHSENDLALNVDHVFEADECDAFDSDVDEGPIIQTMFMTSLTSEDRIYDEAVTSYDSNTPSEVQDHDTFVNHLDDSQ
ncbi:hypothetical protein Tco_0385065 [Tanacetum coccineum]